MATLYISEFSKVAMVDGRMTAVGLMPPVAEQTVTIAGASAPSAAVNAATKYVRLHTDTACFVAFGTSPTAVTASSLKLAANQTEYFGVSPGFAVAVIA